MAPAAIEREFRVTTRGKIAMWLGGGILAATGVAGAAHVIDGMHYEQTPITHTENAGENAVEQGTLPEGNAIVTMPDGGTIITLAQRIAMKGDIEAVQDELIDQNGGSADVQVGQEFVVEQDQLNADMQIVEQNDLPYVQENLPQ